MVLPGHIDGPVRHIFIVWKKMKHTRRKFGIGFGVLAVLATIAAYFSLSVHAHPLITVTNSSHEELRDVVLVGSGFSKNLGRIPPHRSVSTEVQPQGESGLEIRFVTASREVRKGDLAYLEASAAYRAHITVSEDLAVSCRSTQTAY